MKIREGSSWLFVVGFFLWIVLSPLSVMACGWWGDGEDSDSDEAVVIGADGRPVGEPAHLRDMKLPGEMGYGIAVPSPDKAMPYLQATFGQPVTRIGELKEFGFHSVIDLATPEKTAQLHRMETEALGMQYFHISIKGNSPVQKQFDLFNQIVKEAQNGPLLVYAPNASLLGLMWATYRKDQGVPTAFAIQEGRAFGLTSEQEKKL